MKDIVSQFIAVETAEQKSHYIYNPDIDLYLLSAYGLHFDNALFVLVETDYFDVKSAEFAIKEKFQTESVEWVQPNYKKIISIQDNNNEYVDTIDLVVRHDGKTFALALITDRTLRTKYL